VLEGQIVTSDGIEAMVSANSMFPPVRVGSGAFTYLVSENWAQKPAGYSWQEVSAVAVDSKDNVFVFNRGEHPVMVFDRTGRFVRSWGEGVFARAHGITIGPDDSVYCTDDLDHTVRKFSPDGTLIWKLGTSGQPSNTGATSIDYRTITHAGPPFYFPTNSALSPEGDLYVADGYGNARIHRFSANGRLVSSWGEPGTGPGQFHVPHGIAVDRNGNVFVADRENSRLQSFDPCGKFLGELTDVARPCQVAFDTEGNLFVAELGYRSGMWPGTMPPSADATGGRVSVFRPDGSVLARWGGGLNPMAPGDFFAPHDIRVDSRGDVYVSEVVWSAGANRGHVSPECHTLQKFVREKI
jgi:DNA-binding beta-propeller fold protein YncE